MEKKKISVILLSLSLITLFFPPIIISIAGFGLVIPIGEIFLYLSVAFRIKFNARIKIDRVLLLYGLYIYFSFFSLINSISVSRFIIGFQWYVTGFVALALVARATQNKKEILLLVRSFYLGIILLALQVIANTLFVNGGRFLVGNKIQLSIGGSNFLATFFLLLIPLGFNYFLEKKRIRYFAIFTLAMVGLVYTASRSALLIAIGYILIKIILVLFSRHISVPRKIQSLLTVSVLIGLVSWSIKDFILEQFSYGRFDDLSEQGNLLSRVQVFEVYWEKFISHPILGNGYLNVEDDQVFLMAHNWPLQFLADGGFLSTLLIIGVVFYLVWTAYNTARNMNDRAELDVEIRRFPVGYFEGLILFLVHGFFEPNFNSKLGLIIVFSGYGLTKLIKNMEVESNEKNNDLFPRL
ncbi:O-antigen ligase family protein [Enterococcus xiangfangensis]|uniref:O-antigen ligase family protein n=1 Tax=Enterococcus xiangfangensis TaxID=1296537 RepID=A0ABU3FA83_9ENTE|nr:O-antigen ligase family protein [Enterococcus xiangfangensis]MDT2759582.1 O-antigen ligase family protein [Enterococcus xiangfangensis]